MWDFGKSQLNKKLQVFFLSFGFEGINGGVLQVLHCKLLYNFQIFVVVVVVERI